MSGSADPDARSGTGDGPENRGLGSAADRGIEHSTRQAIFEHVRSHPGVHFSQLRRDLDLGTGGLQHHLRELEREGYLESEERRGKRRVFVANALDDGERALVSVLRTETPRKLLRYLLAVGSARTSELATAGGVTPATTSWHLSILLEEGIVERVDSIPPTSYRLRNPGKAALLLGRYRESFPDGTLDRAADRDG